MTAMPRLPTFPPVKFMAALVVIPLGLGFAAASAQEVPADVERDLWCGTAFELMVADEPADASPEKLAAAQPYVEGAHRLIQRALPIYLEAGYTDDALLAYRQKLEANVSRVVNGGSWNDGDQSPTYEDCKALLGQ